MKNLWNKIKQSKVFWIALVIVIQTVVYLVAGMNKAYIHMDEAYSMGLTNWDKVELADDDLFYNWWHPGSFYEDYLRVDWFERWELGEVFNNQANDVHPPLFYLLLRIAMEFTWGRFSIWSGIGLNIMIFAVNAVFVYLIVEKLMGREKHARGKTFVLTLATMLTLAAVSTVIYIRMYALLTLMVTVTAYLHMRLLDSGKLNRKLLVGIGVMAVLGTLTQYYYLFFLAPVFVMMVVKYWKEKRWQELKWYVGVMLGAGVLVLILWPHIIKHLLFSNRGQGVIGNLLNFTSLGIQVAIFAGLVTLYDFHLVLPALLVGMFALAIYGLKRRKKLEVGKKQDDYYKILLWPSLVYFVIAAVASPFTDLRYLEAVCGLLFIVVMFGLYKLVGLACTEKARNIWMSVVLVVMALVPVAAKLEPDVEYSRWAEVVEIVEENHNLPAIYIYDRERNGRFLDDILLFTKLDDSYIMPGDYTVENFRKALDGKDISKGILVFANYGYENQEYLDILKEATGLEEQEYLFRLNAADLYLLR